jgi:acetyl esterase/lipase
LGPERVRGVIAFYPPLDFTKPERAPEKRITAGFVIPPFIARFFQRSYLLPSHLRTDPRISPILGPTASFPKHVYLTCGNADSLYDPVEKFVQRLKDAGHNDAEFMGLEYMGHGFDIVAKEGTEAAEKKHMVHAGAVDMINRGIGASR